VKKKFLIIVAIVIVICVGLIFGVVSMMNKNHISSKDIYNQIIVDSFSEDTKIENLIKEEVRIKVKDVNEESIQISVDAPNISEDLIEWVSKVEDINDNEFEDEILSLIENAPQSNQIFELEYAYDEKGNVTIQYLDKYYDFISCGLNEFYIYAMNQVLAEMGEDAENE